MSSISNPSRGVVGHRCYTERAGRLQSKRVRRCMAAKAFPDGKRRVLAAWTGILGRREGWSWQTDTEQASQQEPEASQPTGTGTGTFTKDTPAAAQSRKDEANQNDPVFGAMKIPHGMRFFFKHELVTEGVFSPVLISVGTTLPLLVLGMLLWPQIVEQLSALPEFLEHAKL